MRSISKYKYLVWSILLLIALAVFLCWKHYSSNSNVLSHTVRLPVQHTSLSTVQSGVSKQSKNFALLSGGIADASEEHAYAWVLPVHRFSGHHDAEQLLEKMQESGFDSYIETKRSVNGSLSFRVLILIGWII